MKNQDASIGTENHNERHYYFCHLVYSTLVRSLESIFTKQKDESVSSVFKHEGQIWYTVFLHKMTVFSLLVHGTAVGRHIYVVISVMTVITSTFSKIQNTTIDFGILLALVMLV